MTIAPHIKTAIVELIDTLCAQTASGRARRKLAEMFLNLPDRDAWPDYYRAIPEPRSINGIKATLHNNQYKMAEDVYEDLTLVMLNAEFYNEEGSQIWKDADTLKTFIEHAWRTNPVLPAPRTTPNHNSPMRKKTGGKTVQPSAVPAPSNAALQSLKLLPPKASSSTAVKPQPTQPTPPSTSAVSARPSNFAPLTKVAPQQPTPYSHSHTGSHSSTPAATASTSQVQLQAQAQTIHHPQAQASQQQHQQASQGAALNAGNTPSGRISSGSTPDPAREDGDDGQGEEFVIHLERGLPRWPGPGELGWTDQLAKDLTPARVMDFMKESKGPTLRHKSPSDSLSDVPEDVMREASYMSPLSFSMIDVRACQDYYKKIQDFDLDMMRLLEKARRYYDPGTTQYGHVLTCQRMYQQLMTSNPPSFPATFSPSYFSSIAAGPGTAKPLNSTDPMDDGKTIVTSSQPSVEDRTFREEVWYKGSKYAAGDWVHLANPDDPMRPIVGQIFKTWISDEGSKKGRAGITVCWYFRPEQTVHSESRRFWEGEVFKSEHFADHTIEDIIEKVAVQFTAKHIRGRPRPPYWYPNWPIYICASSYNDRDHIFVKVKDWTSCVPDEVKNIADWMPIYPFEQTVTPRTLSSPFLRGITGPGTFEEVLEEEKNDNGRRKTRRAAEKSAATNLEIAKADRADSNPPTQGYYNAPTTTASRNAATSAAAAKATNERGVITAAGGLSYIASMEKLPPEVAKLFDRDPKTNEVFWFSGPPIDIPRPRPPRHSLEYLHFLAKKRKREREQAAESKDDGKNAEQVDGMVIDVDAESDVPPAKIQRKSLTQMIDEFWAEYTSGRQSTTA